MMPSNHLILCHPLLLLPSIFPSIGVFSNESALWYQEVKVVELQLQHQSFQWIFGLISFRIDWFDLLAAQGTLKSLLQHHSSKALILQCSAFFMVQLTSIHDYWKNHIFDNMDLCQQSDIGVFNMLSRIVIDFLPRRKHLLISWLQSPAVTVPLEPKKIKSVTVSIVSPSVCHEAMGLDAMISVFWMLSFKPAFPLSSFTFSKRPFSSSLLSAIRVVLYEVVDISPSLILACASSSLAFRMIYSA